MDLGILIRGVFGLIIALVLILFPKKINRFFWVWIPFIIKFTTIKELWGEEKSSKIVFWVGGIILLISLGFIIYGILA